MSYIEGLSAEELRVEQAANRAERVLSGEDLAPSPGKTLARALRQATMESPLRSLAIAFVLGILAARR